MAEQKPEEATEQPKENLSDWKEFDEFYSAHELQLYGMSFPKSLGESLYFKLKNEVFDTNNFFQIMDNQDECRYLLKAKREIKKHEFVFLVDHAWTYKLRQYNEFCKTYPQIIKRATTMLKYGSIKKDIISLQPQTAPTTKKDLQTYVAELAASAEAAKNLDFDDYNITSDNFDVIQPKDNTETISFENNQIDNIQLIYELIDKYKNIKGLWMRDNVCCEVNEGYEKHIYENHPNIEILNRKFTPNAGDWAVTYLMTQTFPDWATKYNEYYGNEKFCDLSGRDPFIIKNFSIFNKCECDTVDLTDNEYSFSTQEEKDKLISLLKSFPKKLTKIIVDDEDDIFDMEDDENKKITPIFEDKEFLSLIQKELPNIKYINAYSIETIQANNSTKGAIMQMKRNEWVHKYIWTINKTYRLITSEKFDEDSIWYINDEFGTAINHSDVPNMAMFPFIFSRSGKFEKDELITYSLLWPLKDIKNGDEIYIDFLANISENEERSARLTTWFNTPKEYFMKKFEEKVKKFTNKDLFGTISKFKAGIENLINLNKEKKEITNNTIKEVFNFDLANKDEKLIENSIKKIKEAIENYNKNPKMVSEYFKSNFKDKKIKVATDLPYVKENMKLPNFEFTNTITDADIIWSNANVFNLLESSGAKPKEIVYKNQYPFENIITMKNHLTDLIQNNAGFNKLINLSYDMQTELAEIIGNFYYNQDNNFDNSWIMKPINMSRSMDITVTDNLLQIIRSVETGPKICQKYVNNPLTMNKKKFDLRFIIALKSLVPLELYFYSKMFWIRSANKNFSMESTTFEDYEVHFTVMNYNTFGMQTIYDKDFIKYLKDNNIDWDVIYGKLKKQIEIVFLLAAKDCPQMVDQFSKSIYGLDAMIDENLEPKIIEINFQPDCTRACKFVPEFYDDLFKTLFLDEPSGVEKV